MRAHIFQHVPFEGPGSIGPWLSARGAEVTQTRFYEGTVMPSAEEIDLLVVMGGPMSVHDEGLHPWLRDEKRFIDEAIGQERAVLGICLGAQLIAATLGAAVCRNPDREIGWFPVHAVSLPQGAAKGVPRFALPRECLVFHWHGETFQIPAGAVRLARSEACPNQAFQYGRSVIGLQFHLETTPHSVRQLVAAGRDELIAAPFVQSEAEILAVPEERCLQNNRLMDGLLSFLTGGGLSRTADQDPAIP